MAVLLTIGLANTKTCCAQTVASGHVTAEVIESISTVSQAVTSFALETNSVSTPTTVDLGAVTINSGSNVTCNVVLKQAALTNAQGISFTCDPNLNNSQLASVAQTNGSQTLQLSGTANLAASQASGLYQGSYAVVFAYN